LLLATALLSENLQSASPSPIALSGDATQWIEPGAFGTRSILGVYADDRTHTLWTCSRFASTRFHSPLSNQVLERPYA
jgi:hypothetical protein